MQARPAANLLRALKTLFGFIEIREKRYYTFRASPKIPWDRLWPRTWKMIPEPETNGRLLVALDDFINPKTGKKIFGCANVFDHHVDLRLSVGKNSGPLHAVAGRNHFAFSDRES